MPGAGQRPPRPESRAASASISSRDASYDALIVAILPRISAAFSRNAASSGIFVALAASAVFFEELGLRQPDHNLNIGSGPHGSQTAQMLTALEPLMQEQAPDAVLVYGDTNSTLAGALAASMLLGALPAPRGARGLLPRGRHLPRRRHGRRVLGDRALRRPPARGGRRRRPRLLQVASPTAATRRRGS